MSKKAVKKSNKAEKVWNVLCVLSICFWVWVLISWFDYAANDMHNTEDASWNIFTIMTEARDTEEKNVNTGAC